MRISDWSSDVCSSDLVVLLATKGFGGAHRAEKIAWLGLGRRRRDRVGARLRCRRLGHIERGGGGVARRHPHGKPKGEDSVLVGDAVLEADLPGTVLEIERES